MGIKTYRAKPTKVFQNLPPDKHPDTHMCEEMLRNVKKWVRNVSFSGNFVYVLNDHKETETKSTILTSEILVLILLKNFAKSHIVTLAMESCFSKAAGLLKIDSITKN